jgi:hypothetical protein
MKPGLSGLKRRIEGSHVLTGALSSDTEASTRTALVQTKQERTNAQLLTGFHDLACVKVERQKLWSILAENSFEQQKRSLFLQSRYTLVQDREDENREKPLVRCSGVIGQETDMDETEERRDCRWTVSSFCRVSVDWTARARWSCRTRGGISKIAFLWSELKNRHPPRVIVDWRYGRVYGEEYAG